MNIRCSSLWITLVISSIIAPTHSIRCYECNSLITPSCGDPFTVPSTETKYVADSCNRCLTRTRLSNDTTVFDRGCSSLTLNECITISDTETQCFCASDVCNMSPELATNVTVLFMGFISVLLLCKLT